MKGLVRRIKRKVSDEKTVFIKYVCHKRHISRIGKFLETKSKLKLPVLGEGRNSELLNGYRVSVCANRKFWKQIVVRFL